MSLYRDIRPESFQDFIGNDATVGALEKVIKKAPDKRPHSFLFSGPSGCGKTTIARILAKGFGCNIEMDYMELNVANTRGIDTIREVIETAYISPMGGTCRVFVFDEAHQLTKDAQNGLLKVLEDFPAKSYFIFCSTDPQKIIATIKNRCSIYEVETLRNEELFSLIEQATDYVEKEHLDEDTIYAIIDAAEGSPRKALTILEKVLEADEKEAQLQLIEQTSEDTAEVIDLCRALIKGAPTQSIMELYKKIENKDVEGIRRAILGYMKAVLLNSSNDVAFQMIKIFKENTYDCGEPLLVAMLYEASTL